MVSRSRRVRLAWLIVLVCGTLPVGCVQGVFREAQFGALDGVNGFVADGVGAVLTAWIPFFSAA